MRGVLIFLAGLLLALILSSCTTVTVIDPVVEMCPPCKLDKLKERKEKKKDKDAPKEKQESAPVA